MSSLQKRIALSVTLLGVALVAVMIGLSLIGESSPSTDPTLSFSMTLDPTVVANLTSIPQATPLSDEDAEAFLTFSEKVETCADYSDVRREQMLQHIGWLIDQSQIPTDVTIALGTKPEANLIFGMAGFTSTQWRLLDRPADSCLIEIGRDLNILLEEFGRPAFTIYDE